MEKHTTTAKSKITRRNYSRISGSLELPNLVEIQTNSYKWFKEVGIKEVFDTLLMPLIKVVKLSLKVVLSHQEGLG